jgi:hypothetical protein
LLHVRPLDKRSRLTASGVLSTQSIIRTGTGPSLHPHSPRGAGMTDRYRHRQRDTNRYGQTDPDTDSEAGIDNQLQEQTDT